MARLHLLLVLVALVSWATASSAPTFCKCTCFKTSTIIPLGPQPQPQARSPPSSPSLSGILLLTHHPSSSSTIARRTASASCAQCTKAFCLEHRIPFCADATEDDVATLCFQRDSNKDRVIVWGFMVGVVALLGSAAVRRGMEWRRRRMEGGGGRTGGRTGDTDVGRGVYVVLQEGTPGRD